MNTTGGGYGIRFPDHYVTAFDYTKARELEASGENILGFEENGSGTSVGLGDQIDEALRHPIDDMGVTGYNNNEDLDLETARPDGEEQLFLASLAVHVKTISPMQIPRLDST